jgi:hypothetical protein
MIAVLSLPLPEGGPLADRSSSSDSASSSGAGTDTRPPGLGEQFGRTRSALIGLIAAHFKLLSAELAEIMDIVKRAAALGGAALGLVFLAGMLAFVGTILWLDEWAFGSIGWGVLHGSLLLIAVAVTLVLLIFPKSAPRVGLGAFVAFVVAGAVFLILWLQLSSRAWSWVGSNFFGGLTWFDGHAVSAADKPIAAAVIVFWVLFGAIGLLVGLFLGRGFGRIVAAIAVAIVAGFIGGLLGAFFGVPMSWGISLAVALAVFLPLHAALAAFFVIRKVDFDELKNRMMPTQTIATTKETIEWVREQMPLGRKS